MRKMNPSKVSISEQLSQNDDKQLEKSKVEYLVNLKSQCAFKDNALKTAECLIAAYKKENQELKQENLMLKERVSQSEFQEQEINKLKDDNNELQMTLLQKALKINELLEKYMNSEEKNHQLEQQNQLLKKNPKEGLNTIQVNLEKQYHLKDNHRKDLESQFKNYLKLPKRSESVDYASPEKDYLKTDIQKKNVIKRQVHQTDYDKESEVKILKWKLKQKQQEVKIVLQRSINIEDKLEREILKTRGEKKKTTESTDNYSTKKNYISQFYH